MLDDQRKYLVDCLNRDLENIDRVMNAPSGVYGDFVKMLDGQAKIAADRNAGKPAAPPQLTVVDGGKGA